LRHYATSRKVTGSILDEVIGFFFNLPNSTSLTMALCSTQNEYQKSCGDFTGIAFYFMFILEILQHCIIRREIEEFP
jgi:hypothetical protein